MINPAENPHIAGLLKSRGLEIDTKTSGARNQFDSQRFKIGDIKPEGTIIGFCKADSSGSSDYRFTAVIYDESKEGSDDALRTIEGLWALPAHAQ